MQELLEPREVLDARQGCTMPRQPGALVMLSLESDVLALEAERQRLEGVVPESRRVEP